MPPFIENLLQNFQGIPALQGLMGQGQGTTLAMLIFGFAIFRRIGLFSLTGLLPILLIVGFMFSQDGGVQRVLQDTVGGGGSMPGMSSGFGDSNKYLIAGVILLFLFGGSRIFMPLRGMSLGTGLFLIGMVLFFSGWQVQLPSGADSPTTLYGVLALVLLLLLWRSLGTILWMLRMGSQWRFHKRLAKLQEKSQIRTQERMVELEALGHLARSNPAAYLAWQERQKRWSNWGPFKVLSGRWLVWLAGSSSVVALALLYFAPHFLGHIPRWQPQFAPYLFVGALACLGAVVLKLSARSGASLH